MECDELFLREVRDGLGIAARFMAIRRIGIKGMHDAAFEQIIGGRQRPLHLIIDHAAVAQGLLRLLDLIMPALLHEHLRILAHGWIKDGVEIDIHEVLEILVIATGYRIHRLVRIRHRVEEGVERALDELDERFLERILARAAECRMLHDMRDARIIRRRLRKEIEKSLLSSSFCRMKTRAPLLTCSKV